jgi:hypothetical protein
MDRDDNESCSIENNHSHDSKNGKDTELMELNSNVNNVDMLSVEKTNVPEQDSGYLTVNSSEEESNGTGLCSDLCENDTVETCTDDNLTVNTRDVDKIDDDKCNSEKTVSASSANEKVNNDFCHNNSNLDTDIEMEKDLINVGDKSKDILSICSETNTPSVPKSNKKSSKLAALAASLPPAPRLSGGPDSFIDLTDEQSKNTPKASPGVQKLMDRLMKHSQKKLRKAKDVEIR